MADVVTLVQDLLFASKIREACKSRGVLVKAARDPASFAQAASEARLAIVDLRLPMALAAVQSLASSLLARDETSSSAVRVVGFVDHERTDVMDAARAAGCTDVMAKGQFANALPKLLAALAPA